MGDPRSTRADAERNRQLLLDSAARALALNPEATLGEVAHVAGLTRATLYRHFNNRENLLEALREDALLSARAAVASAHGEEGTALEALRRVVDAILPLGPRFRPLLIDGAGQDPEFVKRREEVFAPVVGIVERGQREGEIRADLTAQWVVASLTALLAAGVRASPGAPSEHVAEMIFGTLTGGIHSDSSKTRH